MNLLLRYGLLVLGVAACEPSSRAPRASTSSAALEGEGTTTTFAWGSAPEAIGLRPGGAERAALGAPAVAVLPEGKVLVLDAVQGRVVCLDGREIITLARVPKDADDLAVGPDGAFAVKRSVKPEVLVLAPNGRPVGTVDTGAIDSIDTIALGLSRRVVVTTPFQESFTVGSPSVPQLAEQVLHGKREGAAFLDGGRGVSAVRTASGELELHVLDPLAEQGARVVSRHALGKGASARVVGASGSTACLRVEHVSEGQGGAIAVAREAVCLDAVTGAVRLRTKLPPPGIYAPRRELAFGGSTLAFVNATEAGLSITTWNLDGGAR
jgi:hypothetical protein